MAIFASGAAAAGSPDRVLENLAEKPNNPGLELTVHADIPDAVAEPAAPTQAQLPTDSDSSDMALQSRSSESSNNKRHDVTAQLN